MADKKITDLTLRSSVNDDILFPADDTVQTYRVTAPQVAEYALAKPRKIVYKSATYTAAPADHVISCDASGGDFTINLPTAVGIEGKMYIIKSVDDGYVTVDANSTETIDGDLTFKLLPRQGVTLISDNSGWLVLDGRKACFMGSINWAATSGQNWSRQAGSFGAMTASGSIPSPTMTNLAQDPTSSKLGVKFGYLPKGNYKFVITGDLYQSGGNQTTHMFRITDGTNFSNEVISRSPGSDKSFTSIDCSMRYSTDQSNITFEVQAYCPAVDTIYADLGELASMQIEVYFYPDA